MRSYKFVISKEKMICFIYTLLICMSAIVRIVNSSYLENILFIKKDVFNSFFYYFCIITLIVLIFWQNKFSLRKFAIISVITIVVVMITIKFVDISLLTTYLFIFAFPKGIFLNKLAKCLVYCFSIFILLIFSESSLGMITNDTLFQHNTIRYSCGFVSANAFANTVSLGLLLYIYYKYDNWKFFNNIICIVIISFTYYYAKSRLALYIIIFDLLIVNLLKFSKKVKVSNHVKYLIYFCSKYAITFLSILCIIITVYFTNHPNSIYFSKIDSIFTGRLGWMVYYNKEYGMHLIGQQIETVSIKDAIANGTKWKNIDNAYILFAIKYGILFLVGMNILYILLGKYVKKNEKNKDAIYIICMCLIGLTENFLMVSGYNFALLLIAEMINGGNKQKIENKSNSNQEGYMLNYEKR